MNSVVRVLIGYRIGALTAALPMVLSWWKWGAESYCTGFMTCLLVWWLWEQTASNTKERHGDV